MKFFVKEKFKPTIGAVVIKKDGTQIDLGVVCGKRSIRTRLKQWRLRRELRGG